MNKHYEVYELRVDTFKHLFHPICDVLEVFGYVYAKTKANITTKTNNYYLWGLGISVL